MIGIMFTYSTNTYWKREENTEATQITRQEAESKMCSSCFKRIHDDLAGMYVHCYNGEFNYAPVLVENCKQCGKTHFS